MSERHRKKMALRKKSANAHKAAERAEAIHRYQTCCQHNLEPWDCHCSRGCDACGINQKCAVCNRGYRPSDIISLTQPPQAS